MNLPDFLIIPSQLIKDKNLQPLDCQVYGIIYWYSQMKLEKCTASNNTIAELLNSHPGSISRSINRLATGGYIKITIDKKKGNYRELFPTVTYTPNGVPPIHQMVDTYTPNGVPNKEYIIRKEEDTKVSSIDKGDKSFLIGSSPQDLKDSSASEVTPQAIAHLINLFKPINPEYEKLFAMPSQRGAIARLAQKYGVDNLESMLTRLPDIVSQNYAPMITTPYQLEKKFPELVLFVRRQKGGDNGRSKLAIIRPDPSWNTRQVEGTVSN